MDKDQLLERIAKKEENIKKLERKIIKWSNRLTDKDLEMASLPFTKENNLIVNTYKRSEYTEPDYDHYGCALDELRSANRDLAEAELTLKKYRNQLDLIVERDSKEKIPALVEFFNQYKKEVIRYIENNMNHLLEFHKYNKKLCDWHNSKWSIIRNNEITEEEYQREERKLRELEEEERSKVHPITRQVYSKRFEDFIDREELNTILDKDIDAKYWNMIEKVTKITGEIIDASNLTVGGDGNLNGIVIGTEGKAKLETILAGGYNQNVIVNVKHGQVLHYRLLVSKIND